MSTTTQPNKDVDEPTALREAWYMYLAISVIVVSALWNLVDPQVVIAIELSLLGLIFSGWIKKYKDAALLRVGKLLSLKDDKILELQRKTDEFVSKNRVLNDLVDKLNALIGLKAPVAVLPEGGKPDGVQEEKREQKTIAPL